MSGSEGHAGRRNDTLGTLSSIYHHWKPAALDVPDSLDTWRPDTSLNQSLETGLGATLDSEFRPSEGNKVAPAEDTHPCSLLSKTRSAAQPRVLPASIRLLHAEAGKYRMSAIERICRLNVLDYHIRESAAALPFASVKALLARSSLCAVGRQVLRDRRAVLLVKYDTCTGGSRGIHGLEIIGRFQRGRAHLRWQAEVTRTCLSRFPKGNPCAAADLQRLTDVLCQIHAPFDELIPLSGKPLSLIAPAAGCRPSKMHKSVLACAADISFQLLPLRRAGANSPCISASRGAKAFSLLLAGIHLAVGRGARGCDAKDLKAIGSKEDLEQLLTRSIGRCESHTARSPPPAEARSPSQAGPAASRRATHHRYLQQPAPGSRVHRAKVTTRIRWLTGAGSTSPSTGVWCTTVASRVFPVLEASGVRNHSVHLEGVKVQGTLTLGDRCVLSSWVMRADSGYAKMSGNRDWIDTRYN
ncbi:hypothetical protein B0H17DRAFT_1144934 [Mycena rosella]|uniref:Uncharacterized protein n=1 Tax=Mycena rosella TaxID=1033263 RepID=A0AAD7CT06_MYCRO|nr:hypothetical protein B0H17DRAFT_1144934 [Mycena rosella]